MSEQAKQERDPRPDVKRMMVTPRVKIRVRGTYEAPPRAPDGQESAGQHNGGHDHG